MTGIVDKLHIPGKLVYDIHTKENVVDFRISQFYLNNTDQDVLVLHRNNIPIKVDRSSGGFVGMGSFSIRTVYHFNTRSRIIDTITNLTNYRELFKMNEEELIVVHETLKKAFQETRDLSFLDIVIDKDVPIRSIRDQSAFYIPEADVVICDSRSFLKYPHPYSKEGLALAGQHSFIETAHVSGVFVELIDNDNTIKNRYMYVAKQLIEIPARQDKNKTSGVYFTVAQFDRHNEVKLAPLCYSFDEAENVLGLYKTREEAYTGGNPELLSSAEETRIKKELADAKTALERQHLETEQLKQETEREKMSHQRHQAILERDLEEQRRRYTMLKEELELAKVRRANKSEKVKDKLEKKKRFREDYYEDRSYGRKDTHEFLKTSALVITAGLSLYAIVHNKG